MRFALYVSALIVSDAILRSNYFYHEIEMFWLAMAGGLFLIMDLCDWTRTTWAWLHDKDWKIWRKRDYGKFKISNPVKYRYGPTYRGANVPKRGGS
jgi:hypothetical protein